MYAKIIDNQIIKYPYTIQELRKDYFNISFPDTIEVDFSTLAEFNTYRVFPTPQPEFDPLAQKLEENSPVLNNDDNRWYQSWKVVDLSDRENKMLYDSRVAEVKATRHRLLIESDWTQYKDIPDSLSSKWVPYRQALRDITEQSGFPWNVTWPTLPT